MTLYILSGLMSGIGIAFTFEATKRVNLHDHTVHVSWLSGFYGQKFELASLLFIELEHFEDIRYGVRERVKMRQGRNRCAISSVMIGFE